MSYKLLEPTSTTSTKDEQPEVLAKPWTHPPTMDPPTMTDRARVEQIAYSRATLAVVRAFQQDAWKKL